MEYKFNLAFQAVYGVFGFLSALAILYLFTNQINWISSFFVGVGNFLISGYFTKMEKCKQ